MLKNLLLKSDWVFSMALDHGGLLLLSDSEVIKGKSLFVIRNAFSEVQKMQER